MNGVDNKHLSREPAFIFPTTGEPQWSPELSGICDSHNDLSHLWNKLWRGHITQRVNSLVYFTEPQIEFPFFFISLLFFKMCFNSSFLLSFFVDKGLQGGRRRNHRTHSDKQEKAAWRWTTLKISPSSDHQRNVVYVYSSDIRSFLYLYFITLVYACIA